MSIIHTIEGYLVFDAVSGHFFTLTRDFSYEQTGFILRDELDEVYAALHCMDASYAARCAYKLASWYLRRKNWLDREKR